jgi:hypothetical protein
LARPYICRLTMIRLAPHSPPYGPEQCRTRTSSSDLAFASAIPSSRCLSSGAGSGDGSDQADLVPTSNPARPFRSSVRATVFDSVSRPSSSCRRCGGPTGSSWPLIPHSRSLVFWIRARQGRSALAVGDARRHVTRHGPPISPSRRHPNVIGQNAIRHRYAIADSPGNAG